MYRDEYDITVEARSDSKTFHQQENGQHHITEISGNSPYKSVDVSALAILRYPVQV